MNCPHCSFSGHRMDLHAHLVERHANEITITADEHTGKMMYTMRCPICNQSATETLKKSASVLEEYRREICMVAFDLLLYHLQEHHPDVKDERGANPHGG
jgi:transposase-like protein